MFNYILDNTYYIVNLISIFVLFLSSWLVYDALKVQYKKSLVLRGAGFALIGFSFIFEHLLTYKQASVVMFIGLAVFLVGVSMEAINPIPERKKEVKLNAISPLILIFGFLIPLINTVLSFLVTYQLWLRYSKGYVREYKNLVIFFIFLALSNFVSASFQLRGSENIFVSGLSREYGALWFFFIFFRIMAIVYISLWVFNYLRFRLYPLMFAGITGIVVTITVLTAILNSSQLFFSIRGEFVNRLERNAESIKLGVTQLEENAQTSANLLSLNPELNLSLQNVNYERVRMLAELFTLSAESIDYIVITDKDGKVIVDTFNPDNLGNSLASDLLINRAIAYKESNSGLILEKNSLNSFITVKAVSPIMNNNNILGSVQIGNILDNAYTDKIKSQTGLDVIIFAEKTRSATTFTASDQVSRLINLEETNTDVLNQVLEQGNNFTGETLVLNVPYYSSYIPLSDPRGIVIGMIFTGEPQNVLINALNTSNQTIFSISLMLTIFAFFPSKWLADYISRNVNI